MARSTQGQGGRWPAVALLVVVGPPAVFLTIASLGFLGRTFPGFFVLSNRTVPIALFNWTGPRAGVPVGSRVLAVDDDPVSTNAEVYAYADAQAPDTPVRYTLAWNDRIGDVDVPTMRFGARDYLLTFGLIAFSGALMLVAGAVVRWLRPRDRGALAYLMLGTANALYLFGSIAAPHPIASALSPLLLLGAALLPASLLHLGLVFPIERPLVQRRPWLVALPYVAALPLLLWATADYYAESPRTITPTLTIVRLSMLVLAGVIGAAALSYWRNRSYLVRPRLNAMTPGVVLASAVGLIGLLTMAQGGGTLSIVLATLVHPLLFVAIGYGIVTGDRADRDILLQRMLELEDQVHERTQALETTNAELRRAYHELQEAQTQLLQSEKMAALGQLVAGMAHEINTPVTAVVGNVRPLGNELLRLRDQAALHGDATLDAIAGRLRAIFEVMARGAERTAGIVQDLRVFSHVDETKPQPMDLHEGIDVSVRLLRPRWVDRIVIHRDYGDLPPVEGAAGQMNQVFMNLLVNACDAIAGRGNVWIRTRSDGATVTVVVRDDGEGIPPEIRRRIFDPFFTTKPVGKGTGLGLAISASIVRDHGGTLEVESDPQQHGATFTIALPVRCDASGERLSDAPSRTDRTDSTTKR